MPKSVLDFPDAGPLSAADVLYTLQGVGLDRDRKVALGPLAAWVAATNAAKVILAEGTGVVPVDVAGLASVAIIAMPGVTKIVLAGNALPGAQIFVLNATIAATVAVEPANYDAFTNAIAEGPIAVAPYTLRGPGDSALIFKTPGHYTGWQSARFLAMKTLLAELKAAQDDIAVLSTVVDAVNATGVAATGSGVQKVIATVSVPAGTWLVEGNVSGIFGATATGTLLADITGTGVSTVVSGGAASSSLIAAMSQRLTAKTSRFKCTTTNPSTTLTLVGTPNYENGGSCTLHGAMTAERIQ